MRYSIIFFASAAFAAPILEGVTLDSTVSNTVSEVSQVAGDATTVVNGASLGKRQSLPSLSGVTAPVEGLLGNTLNTVEGSASPVYSTLKGATGGLSLPIRRQLSSVTDTVDGVVGEVTGLTDGSALPSLPVRQVSGVTDTVDGLVGEVTGLTGGAALPSLPVRQVSSVTDTVDGLVGEVTGLTGGAALPSLPVRQVSGLTDTLDQVVGTVAPSGLLSEIPAVGSLDLPKRQLDIVDTVVSEVQGLTGGLPVVNSLPVRDIASLDLSSVVSTLDSALTEVLGVVGQVKASLASIVGNVEAANVAGVLENVESLVSELLTDVQAVINQTPLGLNLAQLNPTVAIVSTEVGGLVATVQGLLDAGVTGEVITDVKQGLAEVLSIVNGLNL